MYIDFHTHIFPDLLAKRSIPFLEQQGKVKAQLDGTLASLLQSMDRANIEKSIICSIATRPSQFDSILAWSDEIRSPRIIPLPSVHPEDRHMVEHIGRISRAGFLGIKLHPYYQQFSVDDKRLFPAYERLAAEKLLVVMHTGHDIAFPASDIAAPWRIAKVVEQFPELLLITTHCGAWKQWEEVRRFLLGRPVYMDVSFSLDMMGREKAKAFLESHDEDYLLFGSDSPWEDQVRAISQVKELHLAPQREEKLLRGNALRLLGRKGEA